MKLTAQQIKKCLPNNKNAVEWLDLLNKYMPMYKINSVIRASFFLGQLAHESNEFQVLKENLNYSVKGLRATFPKYFPNDVIALQYARQPQKIANRVYANRMGNRSEASGDGWRYAGKGLIQLTGADNYNKFSLECDKTLTETVEYLQTKEGALHSACWFWKEKNLNVLSDLLDLKNQTRRINGGYNGLPHREDLVNKYLTILRS